MQRRGTTQSIAVGQSARCVGEIMAKYTILCVGMDIPGEEFECVSFHSGVSLLDADIVLFEPHLDCETDDLKSSYLGKPNLSEESSVKNRKSLLHWHKELTEAFNHGATIFVFLSKPEEVYAATGSQKLSETGGNINTFRPVDIINSYSAIPLTFDDITAAKGKRIKLTQQGSSLLGAYWKDMHSISRYDVYYDQTKAVSLMTTQNGDKTVAARVQGEKGNMLLLPVLDFSRADFTYYNEEEEELWTEGALTHETMLREAVVELHKSFTTGAERTPAPSWVTSENYQLQIEKTIEKKTAQINHEIAELRDQRIALNKQLDQQTLTKGLLYEKGKPLEAAVIEALQTFGFKAEGYHDNESEFDVIFESDEGRFIGEAEGKDSSAINIKKLQQLERNIQEDFVKEHVTEHAKGVLFGNPHRLTEPGKRTTLFTTKAFSSAQRSSFALVHTPDLFPLVQYLKKNRNATFARKVRRCFATSPGKIVKFPAIPVKAKKKGSKPKNSPNKK